MEDVLSMGKGRPLAPVMAFVRDDLIHLFRTKRKKEP